MPDLLRPTNPVPGYDGAQNRSLPVTPHDTSIKNIVDPSRVVRTDGRADRQDAGDAATSSALRYESNFLTFVQRLKDSPDLGESFSRMLLQQGTLVTSGMSEGIADEMAQFLEMMRMNESQLLSFVQNQMKSGARFGGALFRILREAYANAQSDVLQNDILQFLKKFSDFSSTAHIEQNILRNLYQMSEALPSRWANALLSLAAQLQNGMAAGDRAGNLKLLREQIVGTVAGYVSQTHDLGRARGLLSRLTLDIVRYENGAEQGLVQAFRQLAGYGLLREGMDTLSDEAVLRMLRDTEFSRAVQNDGFADRLTELARRALRGEGGAGFQEAFRDIVSSLLIQESVYMPIRHMMLPLEWNGRMMFSEMWVDPDAEGGGSGNGAEKGIRILLKMDIQDLGLFDVLVDTQGERVSLQVACPERVAPFAGTMARGLTEILTANGLRPETVNVAAMKRPMTLSGVFPKIFERKNGINVTV